MTPKTTYPAPIFGPVCRLRLLPRWIVQEASGGHMVIDTLFGQMVGNTHASEAAAHQAIRDIKTRYCGKVVA